MRGAAVGSLWSVLAMAGCTSPLPSGDVEDQLSAYFADRGIEPRFVRCPAPLPKERGASVRCEAQVDDQRVEMIAEVASEQGTLDIRPAEGTLVTATVESEIAQTVRQQGYAVERVRCQGQLWVVRPAAVHHCAIELVDGGRLRWTGTFTGQGSALQMRIEPQPEGTEAGR